MTPRKLDALERTALSQLAQLQTLTLGDRALIGFGRPALERLCGMGLAERLSDTPPTYAITNDGYRCIYGMPQNEYEALPSGSRPPPLRQWQWPPAA